MSEQPFLHTLRSRLDACRAKGLGRSLLPVSARRGGTVVADGRPCLDFCSNDFLGLGRDPDLSRRLAALCRDQSAGAGASRLVTGSSVSLLKAEEALARYFGYEACLLFSSGFLANLTLVSALFSSRDAIAADKRIHASLMAGIRHSRAAFHTFRHNDLDHLEKILARRPVTAVCTESLFSMDADSPDFGRLKTLKDRHDFFCITDEAHTFGVLGDRGRGLGHGAADVAVGTLGKAFGFFGSFVLMPETVREYLIHFGQGFIYTTAPPPWHGDMVLALLERIWAANDRRARLREIGDMARDLLRSAGFSVRGRHHILALETGDEAGCQALAETLRRRGILVLAARYPTVPLGRAMLRICLTSDHQPADLLRLRDALAAATESP